MRMIKNDESKQACFYHDAVKMYAFLLIIIYYVVIRNTIVWCCGM